MKLDEAHHRWSRWLVATVLGVSGCLKLMSTAHLPRAPAERWVDFLTAPVVLETVAWVELVIAVGLFGSCWRTAVRAATILCMVFGVALGVLMLEGRGAGCGCFGAVELSTWSHIALLAGLLLLLASCYEQ